jgi:hypothetical protein
MAPILSRPLFRKRTAAPISTLLTKMAVKSHYSSDALQCIPPERLFISQYWYDFISVWCGDVSIFLILCPSGASD